MNILKKSFLFVLLTVFHTVFSANTAAYVYKGITYRVGDTVHFFNGRSCKITSLPCLSTDAQGQEVLTFSARLLDKDWPGTCIVFKTEIVSAVFTPDNLQMHIDE